MKMRREAGDSWNDLGLVFSERVYRKELSPVRHGRVAVNELLGVTASDRPTQCADRSTDLSANCASTVVNGPLTRGVTCGRYWI